MQIGQIIKARRKELGLTTKDVGQRVGVSDATVSRWENGEIESMRLPLAWKLAQTLHTSIFDFIPEAAETPDQNRVRIPILGHVVCGEPLFAEQNIEGEMYIDAKQAWGTVFGLHVVGNSMEPKLMDGDEIVVRAQPTIEDGDIAIVMVNGDEATCKKVHLSPNGIMLVAFNQDVFPARFFSNAEIKSLPVQIIGKVIESRHKW